MQAVLGVEQSLLAGSAERGAMGERSAEIGVPGVQVGVEVQHRNWAVVAVQRAQQRQRDGVVAAQGDQLCAAVAQLVGGLLDGGDGLGDIERVDRNVAGVGHLLHGERLDVQPRVIGPQQLGRGPDMARTEPGAGSVGDARVERDADHGDVGVWHLVDAGQTGEGGGSRVARHPGGIYRSYRLVWRRHDQQAS